MEEPKLFIVTLMPPPAHVHRVTLSTGHDVTLARQLALQAAGGTKHHITGDHPRHLLL
jgi:hypothetical protein